MGSYARPTELDEALAVLAAGRALVLAGGTDVYPARVGRPRIPTAISVPTAAARAGRYVSPMLFLRYGACVPLVTGPVSFPSK